MPTSHTTPPRLRIPTVLAVATIAAAAAAAAGCGTNPPPGDDATMGDASTDARDARPDNGCGEGCGRLVYADGAEAFHPDGAPYCLC